MARVKHTSPGFTQPSRRVQIFDMAATDQDVTFEIDWPAYHTITAVYGRCLKDIEVGTGGDIDFKLGTTPGGAEVTPLGGGSAPNVLDASDDKITKAGKAYQYASLITLDARGATGGTGAVSAQRRTLYGTVVAPSTEVVQPGAFEFTVEFRQWQ